MSSSITHEPLAIRLRDVSKIYKLHGSQGDQLIDVLGLQRFGFKTKTTSKEFAALNEVSLDVPRGHRVGIVGRNGAGKTTLLKLICGNFSPTTGDIKVNGSVQALMSIGLGFHPEYTGRENAKASLQYNGLGREEYQEAMHGIEEFCELGDFLNQPFKTYSLGMQARLMFAAATAIRPDILIVDEVLGAGDAYFVAKSKQRVEKLIESGCTMLLVSHSMQQVLELCENAIWLDNGVVRAKDSAFNVVKQYEAYIHSTKVVSSAKHTPIDTNHDASDSSSITDEILPLSKNKLPTQHEIHTAPSQLSNLVFQDPFFIPHSTRPVFPEAPIPSTFKFVLPSGLSRWESEIGLKIVGFSIVTESGETNQLTSMQPAKLLVAVQAEINVDFSFRCGIVFLDHMGKTVVKVVSPPISVILNKQERISISIVFNPLQIGPGEYIISLSLHGGGQINSLNILPRYDLIARSFGICVAIPDSIGVMTAEFIHTAEFQTKREI